MNEWNEQSGHHILFDKVTKRFDNVLSVDSVSFDVKPGTVHVILGENGAGKTTLMKLLMAIIKPDHGTILLDGKPTFFSSPKDAQAAGIGMVHQHFSLIPTLSVLENILLADPMSSVRVDKQHYAEKIMGKASEFGVVLEPNQYVWQVNHSTRQWIEIFRLLFLGASTLIFDEPTSVLTPLESDNFLLKIRQLAAAGKTILLITHKLRETHAVADWVTVLRRGKHIFSAAMKDITTKDLIAGVMEGKSHVTKQNEKMEESDNALYGTADSGSENIVDNSGFDNLVAADKNQIIFKIDRCSFLGSSRKAAIKDLSFDLKQGEILGIAGISGNGQQEIAEAVAGMRTPDSGHVEFMDGTPDRMHNYIRYVPADRLGTGCVPELSVAENLSLRRLFLEPISEFGFFLNQSALMKEAEGKRMKFDIKCTGINQNLSTLSGGNIQRVLLAREIDNDCKILVVHEPTSGIDIEGTQFVRQCLRDAASRGCSVLLISSDIDEIFELSDEILVLSKGYSQGIYPKGTLEHSTIGSLMLGCEAGV